jgi:hypothetical protein
MGNKLALWLLGLLETTQYTLEQSHGVPPISVALDNTTLREEGSCGYSSVKTVRSIDHTIEVMNWELKSGLGLGEHQGSGDKNRSEKSMGIAVLAYLFVLRVCHHEIVPGKAWSIFQLQHALRLRVMTNQVEHQVTVKMGKSYKAA